jgi:hypothetical protein
MAGRRRDRMARVALLVVSVGFGAPSACRSSSPSENDLARSDPPPPRASASETASPVARAPRTSDVEARPPPAAGGRNASFLAMFAGTFPSRTCEPQQWFRGCFRVTEAQCEERMRKILAGCIDELGPSLPLVHDGSSGSDAGRILGTCAGSQYEISSTAERIHSAACDDIVGWMRDHPSPPETTFR